MKYASGGKQQKTRRKGQIMSRKEAQLISVDSGAGYIKAVSNMNVVSYPAVIGILSDNLEGFDFNPGTDFVIGFNGARYSVGEAVFYKGLSPESIRHISRVGTNFYRTLFASALASCVAGSPNEVTVIDSVISLPPGMYWEKEKQKEALSGIYEVDVVDDQGGFVTITYDVRQEFMRVIPEGMGTLCTQILTPDGYEIEGVDLGRKVCGVVDVGTFTTDFIMLNKLRIVRSGCDSIPHALNDIYSQLKSFAGKHNYVLDDYRADSIMTDRYITIEGKRQPIDKQLEGWAKSLASVIDGKIRTLWNGGNDVEEIILAGGGAGWVFKYLAKIYGDRLQLSGNDQVPPHMTNAVGGYFYGMLKNRVEEENG